MFTNKALYLFHLAIQCWHLCSRNLVDTLWEFEGLAFHSEGNLTCHIRRRNGTSCQPKLVAVRMDEPSIPVSWWSSANTPEETNPSKQFLSWDSYSKNFSKMVQVLAIAATQMMNLQLERSLTFPSLVASGWSQWNEQWFYPFCCKLAKQVSSSLQPLSLWAPHTSTFTHSLMPLSVSCKQLEILVPFSTLVDVRHHLDGIVSQSSILSNYLTYFCLH